MQKGIRGLCCAGEQRRVRVSGIRVQGRGEATAHSILRQRYCAYDFIPPFRNQSLVSVILGLVGGLTSRHWIAESSTAAASTSATHSSTHSSADPDPTSSPTNSSTESEGGGQSNGPIIGGVVGGVVVLVLAAASLFLLWKRSKRRNAGPAEMDGKGWTPGAQPVAVGGGLPELQGDKYIAPAQLAERNEYNELPA